MNGFNEQEAYLSLRRPIVLHTTYDDVRYSCRAEPNRGKCRVMNSHGHVTRLPIAIPDAEISAVCHLVYRCFVAERERHPIAKASKEVNRKCSPEHPIHSVTDGRTDRQTDRRQYDANSPSSYCETVTLLTYHRLKTGANWVLQQSSPHLLQKSRQTGAIR